MKWRILVSAPYMQPVLDDYRETFAAHDAEIVIPEVHERLSEEELLPLVGDIDGVIAGDDRFSEQVLKKAVPRLKVISKWGTGIDAFDLDACRRLGVVVCNTPGAFNQPVADSVMGYVLCFARKLPWMDQQMKSGIWDKIAGRALHETVLGIIGLGNIGRAVAKRAQVFGMRALANDIIDIPQSVIEETGVQMVSLEELLQRSDFVSVNCDLNPTSVHLMNAAAFGKMKPEGILINMARGSIVDETALVKALQDGEIGGAALDVFEQEPLPPYSPLKTMSNVMLAPHNSNSSPAAWLRVHENTIRNLFEVLEGGR
jgi:D-3-phosphoglycerate dehydrogenase